VTILLAPLVNGIIKKIKALTQKRQGAPVLQLYYDLFKLLGKSVVLSETTSWIFRATPYIVMASALTAAMLVPVTTRTTPVSFPGDIIMLVYVLALSRFFMGLSALDAGSTFGGMGSSRDAMISSLIEPSLLVSVFTIGLASQSTAIYTIMLSMQGLGVPLLKPAFMLTFIALFIIIIAETSRIPVDDPATHLELTMVHEAMVLEYSGRGLALMELGSAIKQLVLMTLLVNVFLPVHQLVLSGTAGLVLSLLIYILKIIGLSVLIAIFEASTVKFRFFSIPNLAALSFILAFLGFLQNFVLGR
jgi:formate hydrogenlyase subunit 4